MEFLHKLITTTCVESGEVGKAVERSRGRLLGVYFGAPIVNGLLRIAFILPTKYYQAEFTQHCIHKLTKLKPCKTFLINTSEELKLVRKWT